MLPKALYHFTHLGTWGKGVEGWRLDGGWCNDWLPFNPKWADTVGTQMVLFCGDDTRGWIY